MMMITQSINMYFSSTLSRKGLTNKKFVQVFSEQEIFKKFLKANGLKLPWFPVKRHQVVASYLSAFTHSSFLNEFKEIELKSYEKLEFFGDVILNFLLTEMIYKKYPELSEGELSKFKSAIVAKLPLSKLSKLQGLDLLLLQGKGESTRPVGVNILGDLFESTLAAIYFHEGLKSCERFLSRSISLHDHALGEKFLSVDIIESSDHKTKLQELTMKLFKVLPRYDGEMLANGSFKVNLYVQDKLLGQGLDKSKKVAEKNAAKEAYLLIHQDQAHHSRGDQHAH